MNGSLNGVDDSSRESVRLARRSAPELSRGFGQVVLGPESDLLERRHQRPAALRSRVAPWLSIRAVGGAVNDVHPAATAFAHRHQGFNVSSVGLGSSEDDFRAHWGGLRPRLDGLYLSFETDRRPERMHDAFPSETLIRLRELKARYDPDDVFNQNFPIPHAEVVVDASLG